MKKKLPKVYANKIEKNINNNEKIYNSTTIKKEENTQEKQTKTKKTEPEKNINKKINEIFNTKNYIYKIPVKIQINNQEIITNLIGKNKNNIITIDNKLIKIEQIQNIEIYKE